MSSSPRDTRSLSLPEPIVQVGSEGHQYVTLNHLSAEQKATLAQGMKQSDKGRKHLQAMREARESLGPLMSGASFRVTRPDYIQYMEDAELASNEGGSSE